MTMGRTLRRGASERREAVVRRHRPDYLIALFMLILMALGLVVMYAIGPQRANVLNFAFGGNYSDTYFFLRQLLSIGLGVAAFAVAATIPYSFILKKGKLLYLIGLGACLLLAIAAVFSLPIAQESYGATRWFDLGPLTFQPAEVLKFGVLLHLAGFLGVQARKGKINDVKETLIPAGVVVGLAALFIVVVQRDLGTGISMVAIILSMLFVSNMSRKLITMIIAGVVVAGVLMIVSAPHRVERVMTFFQGDTTSTDDGSTYHIEHAKIAIGTGGFTGVGIGNSVQATGYLPEAINDSVFAIMGEIFGFVGLLAVMILFVALLMRLLKVMDHLVDERLKLLAAGVFGWFGAHVMLNIGAMIGLTPLTGITLPFLSFGGTSMLFISAALGIIFQLSRYTVHGSHLKEANQHETARSRRGVGRTRYASRRSR